MNLEYRTMKSPFGEITAVSDATGLRVVGWGELLENLVDDMASVRKGGDDSIAARACAQLERYFAGDLKEFDLPLAPQGTEFQRQVWGELCRIPYGKTLSYGEQAARIGRPQASRAVGAANGKNPIGIIIPCHRVISSAGKLTGYAGGLDVKRYLLELEGPGQVSLWKPTVS